MREKASLASRLQCVLLMLVVARTAAANGVIYVDTNAPGANDGSSWENAYVFLQDALADAETADKPVEIRVAQGIYKPDQGENQTLGDRWATFRLINGVTIKGGYTGFSEPYPNTRDIETYETILSGDLNGDDIDINDPCDLYGAPNRYDNSKVVVTGSNTDETAILDGFIVSSGHWDEIIGCMMIPRPIRIVDGGAGMNNSAGSPTVIRCTFTLNATNWHGGGMHNVEGSNPTVIDCIFTMNYAGNGGAAMANRSGCNPKVIDCDFSDNFIQYDGGAMFNINNSPTLTNCTFSRNSSFSPLYGSDTTGGGMYNINSNLLLTNCTFDENSAAIGGGMCNKNCNTVLNMCEFERNLSSYYGGAVANGGQLVTKGCIFKKNYPGAICDHSKTGPSFDDCIFIGNSSIYPGGAVSVMTATFNNCLFAGNRTLGDWSTGGAVYSILTATLNNCTFSNNWADNGCALYCYRASADNCIFWGTEGQIYPDGLEWEYVSADYSNIQGGWPGEGNIDADPLFANPGYWADADDPNIVAEPNDPNAVWIDGDYHLKSQAGRWDPVSESWVFDDVTSPCIDAGDPNSPISFEPFPNGGRINMGAYGGTAEASKSPSEIHAKYGGGTGEPNNPYLIYTAEQMNTIGIEPDDWDKHFKLMADIDLDPNLPDRKVYDKFVIGNFKGVFDGNGHTISNFSYISSNGLFVGFFRQISGQNAQIKDLGLVAPNIYAETGSHVGSLVGMVSSGTITNCYVEGGSVLGEEYVGSLVGWNHGNINDCYSTCNVYGEKGVGGLVGHNDTAITNCSAGGEVFGRDDVGGLAGRNSGTIKNSSATGSVTRENRSIVIGRENRNIGGLIGHNSGPLISCSASGDVSGDTRVGALVGYNNDSIINCYAMGSVFGTEYIGGLVGFHSDSIINCYATGSVSGTTYVGGLVGYKGYEATVRASFWDIQTSGQLISDGGISRSTAQMQTAETFLFGGWDFVGETENGTEDIWWILEGQDYPRLWWELIP